MNSTLKIWTQLGLGTALAGGLLTASLLYRSGVARPATIVPGAPPAAELVAAKITEFLKATDRFAKTIVFCENIDHAERMRQALVNANADLAAANNRYVMRITGDNDGPQAEVDYRIRLTLRLTRFQIRHVIVGAVRVTAAAWNDWQ